MRAIFQQAKQEVGWGKGEVLRRFAWKYFDSPVEQLAALHRLSGQFYQSGTYRHTGSAALHCLSSQWLLISLSVQCNCCFASLPTRHPAVSRAVTSAALAAIVLASPLHRSTPVPMPHAYSACMSASLMPMIRNIFFFDMVHALQVYQLHIMLSQHAQAVARDSLCLSFCFCAVMVLA